MKSALFYLFVVISVTNCPNKGKTLFDDKCPLSYKLEWTIVEEGVDVEKQIDLLTQLSTAAKADAEKLNKLVGNTQAKAEFDAKFELAKTLQSSSIRKASVSQEVFDEYVKIRTASCNLWDAIQKGLYGNDEDAIKEARNLFTRIQLQFAEIEKSKLGQPEILIGNVQIINNFTTPSNQEETNPTIIIEKKTDSVIYFSISNYLNYPITLIDLGFNISLDVGASIDPTNPQPGSFLTGRIDLGTVEVKNKNEQIDILNDEVVIKIKEKDTQSFRLQYSIPEKNLKGVKNYAYNMTGSYIDPKTGGIAFLISETKLNIPKN